MTVKLKIIDLEQLAHLFKNEETLKTFVRVLEEFRQNDPEGLIPVMEGEEHICDLTFSIPKEYYKYLPRHRKLDSDWKPSMD